MDGITGWSVKQCGIIILSQKLNLIILNVSFLFLINQIII